MWREIAQRITLTIQSFKHELVLDERSQHQRRESRDLSRILLVFG